MAKRPNWYNRHPVSCTCTDCVNTRLTRYQSQQENSRRRSEPSRPGRPGGSFRRRQPSPATSARPQKSSRPGGSLSVKRWLSQRIRRLRRVKTRDVFWRAVVVVLLIYVALTIFHLTQGFDFASALGGGMQDVRAVGVCFGEWSEIKEFIARDSVFGKDVGKLALDLSGGQCSW